MFALAFTFSGFQSKNNFDYFQIVISFRMHQAYDTFRAQNASWKPIKKTLGKRGFLRLLVKTVERHM